MESLIAIGPGHEVRAEAPALRLSSTADPGNSLRAYTNVPGKRKRKMQERVVMRKISDRISGQFYGPNHEEVGGVFERNMIVGAFGAKRE